uniref:Uncharacterized protein n=1 Tax=Eutreptiella gymnastica TaxID=73025 RepID=A0A7S4LBU2_9EUGL
MDSEDQPNISMGALWGESDVLPPLQMRTGRRCSELGRNPAALTPLPPSLAPSRLPVPANNSSDSSAVPPRKGFLAVDPLNCPRQRPSSMLVGPTPPVYTPSPVTEGVFQQATVVSSQPLMDIAPPRSMEDLSTVEDVRSLRC